MRKSKEQLKAELIVAKLLQMLTPEETLNRARQLVDGCHMAVAQRATIAIMFATMWDMWEDFTEDSINGIYDRYLEYFESYEAGNERIFNMMLEINKMLGGKLLEGPMLETILDMAEKEGE